MQRMSVGAGKASLFEGRRGERVVADALIRIVKCFNSFQPCKHSI
jgi:hypothetical protein